VAELKLTFRSIELRCVLVPLARPVVSKVGQFEPFEVRNSHIVIPARPGRGIEWNEAAVKRLRFDP
jgi:hypothetical protein